MRIIGSDLHARQQAVAMLDTETGEVVNLMLKHEGDKVREFYSQPPQPVLVGFMRRLVGIHPVTTEEAITAAASSAARIIRYQPSATRSGNSGRAVLACSNSS